jgi:hypothetical protein
MQRDKWEFQYTSKQLLDAAKSKVDFHTARLGVWETRKKQVVEETKEKGLTVEQTEVMGYGDAMSNTRHSGYSPQIMVNAVYQRQLNEAVSKIGEHHQKLSEYESWAEVLSGNKDRTYELNAEDYLFFFGKK